MLRSPPSQNRNRGARMCTAPTAQREASRRRCRRERVPTVVVLVGVVVPVLMNPN